MLISLFPQSSPMDQRMYEGRYNFIDIGRIIIITGKLMVKDAMEMRRYTILGKL